MKFFKRNWRTLVFMTALTVIGAALLVAHKNLDAWRSPQESYYNQGLQLFKEGKVDEALVAFDKSLDSYRAGNNRHGIDKILYPPPSTEWAALAESKKAILYIMKQKAELAVNSFKDSIKLNPGGEQFRDLTSQQMLALEAEVNRLTDQDIQRLDQQSMVVKHNLELLFRKNPSMAQGEGKGGKGKGKGQPGNKPAPGQEPGNQSGRGNRDDI